MSAGVLSDSMYASQVNILKAVLQGSIQRFRGVGVALEMRIGRILSVKPYRLRSGRKLCRVRRVRLKFQTSLSR